MQMPKMVFPFITTLDGEFFYLDIGGSVSSLVQLCGSFDRHRQPERADSQGLTSADSTGPLNFLINIMMWCEISTIQDIL